MPEGTYQWHYRFTQFDEWKLFNPSASNLLEKEWEKWLESKDSSTKQVSFVTLGLMPCVIDWKTMSVWETKVNAGQTITPIAQIKRSAK